MRRENFTDVVKASHDSLAEILGPGDLAVDLTVGNGKDTMFLWESVGPNGCVIGFDIQEEAVRSAKVLLKSSGAEVRSYLTGPVKGKTDHGVHLILADHASWPDYVSGQPKAVIANLGYLPGSDHRIATRAETTEPALRAALDRIRPGGCVAVVCYVGHPGGREEAKAVEDLFRKTGEGPFTVSRTDNPGAENSPFLLVAIKTISD